jgi:CotH protein
VEDDGVNGASGMANFFLYRSAGQTVHQLLPWDKDRALQTIEPSIFARADGTVLFRRAIAYPDLRALYLDVLEQCARRALEDDWLVGFIARASSLIADAAHEDRWKFVTNEEYDAATEFLKEFARQRPAFVLQEVSQAR